MLSKNYKKIKKYVIYIIIMLIFGAGCKDLTLLINFFNFFINPIYKPKNNNTIFNNYYFL